MGEETSKPENKMEFREISCCRLFFATICIACAIASTISISAYAQTNIPGLSENTLSCLVSEAGAPSCATQTSPGSSAIDLAMPQHVGNPINVVTGNKYQYELDYQSISSSLTLDRHYNSTLAGYDIGFGPGWRHTYQVVLTRVSDTQVDIVQSDGRLIHFYLDTKNNDIYKSQAANNGYVQTGGRSVWHLEDGRRMLFQGSFLVLIDMGNNKDKLQLAYSNGTLRSVTDSKGDSLLFNYIQPSNALPKYGTENTNQPDGSISTITLPAGQVIKYLYGDHRNLISALYPDENTLQYKYQLDEWSSHLTNRVSTADKRNSHWSYDSDGRAIGWQEGEDINGLKIARSLEDSTANIDIGSEEISSYASVTYADGRESHYSWSQTQQPQNPGDTTLEIACDNCLPKNATATAELGKQEQHIQSRYDVAMESFRSSLQRVFPHDKSLESLTNYEGIYPHANGKVDIKISTDRTGKVKDFHFGDMTLSDIVSQSTQERTPECSQGTHFQTSESFSHDRIQSLSNGGEPCSLDRAVAVEFIYRVENFNSPEGDSAAFNNLRRKTNPSVPWYDPMRRYCSLPAGMTCSDLEEDLRMARLSECAYGNVSCEPEFRLVDAAEVGLTQSRFSNQGFDAELYQDALNNRYLLVFRGTDGFGDDWIANIDQSQGRNTRQYSLALNLAKDVKYQIGAATLQFSGHSLGGGLATLAALETGGTATIFNAAALQSNTAALFLLQSEYTNAAANIRHIHTDYDPVTVLQERADDLNWQGMQTAPAVTLEIPNPDHLWMNATHAAATTFTEGLAPVLWHGIAGVIHVLQSLIKYNCSP